MSGPGFRWLSRSPEETREIGARLGAALAGPMAIFLIGGFGGGKTVFVQGLARGLGVPAELPVTSPSFVLLQDYPGRILLRHVDLYRLETEAEQEAAGLWEALAEPVVAAVEWAERLPPRMRREGLTVRFAVLGDTERLLTGEAAGQAAASLVGSLDFEPAGAVRPPPEG